MRTRVTRGLALVVLGLTAGLPAGARAADAAVVETAKKEGEVVWYSVLLINQILRPMVEAFEKKYPGIHVKYSRQTTGEVALKLANEARAGKMQADVFDGTAGIFSALSPDLMEKLPDGVARDFPPEYRDPQGYWAAVNLFILTPAINTELVKAADAPKSYQDLLDPKWRGRMAWTTDPTVNGPPGFIGNILITMGEAGGMDYLRTLAGQKIVNVPAAQRVVLDQVINGQYPLGLMTMNHHSAISSGEGAPVAWLKVEPAVGSLDHMGLLKNSPHPNAGKLLAEFVLSEDGQKVVQEANYIPASPNVAAKTPTLKPDEHFHVRMIPAELAEKKLPEWTRIYNELFK
jgi:iron(III) transport system substrate-binding protein